MGPIRSLKPQEAAQEVGQLLKEHISMPDIMRGHCEEDDNQILLDVNELDVSRI